MRRIPTGFKRVPAPKMFDIGTNGVRHELLSFLTDLRNLVVAEREAVLIDFTLTRKMSAGGTLLFLAELHRCGEVLGERPKLRCIPPRNVKVSQVLKQIGVYDLMGYKKKVEPSFSDVIHWRFASGHQVEGEKYENILGTYEGRVTESLLGSLFRGITEAMTNCHHHAYIDVRPDGLDYLDKVRNWWMFSQERDGYLSVIFCDLGVGIPVTLPTKKPNLWDKVLSLGKAGSDSSIIEEAVVDSVSRTGKRYRGKGLKQLLEAAQETRGGALSIFSNRGCYNFGDGKVTLRDYAASIMGTLIQWKVPIIQRELF
ncbi:MAG: hypothetical protein NT159_19260 [Proteobacteria bacterium]|nr:hypothetical protein [Pseudomonadota bacterium]